MPDADFGRRLSSPRRPPKEAASNLGSLGTDRLIGKGGSGSPLVKLSPINRGNPGPLSAGVELNQRLKPARQDSADLALALTISADLIGAPRSTAQNAAFSRMFDSSYPARYQTVG
jgi:hypothetical protein